MVFALKSDGMPTYTLSYKGHDVIELSKLGMEQKDDKTIIIKWLSFSAEDFATCLKQ